MRIRNIFFFIVWTILISFFSVCANDQEQQAEIDSPSISVFTMTPTLEPSPTNTLPPTDTPTPEPTFDKTAYAEEISRKVSETLESYWIAQTPSATPTLPNTYLTTGLSMKNPFDGKELIFIESDIKKGSRGFWISRNEVSNTNYHKCMEEDFCTGPVSSRCADEKNYFYMKTYSDHPVVNIIRNQAETYCTWAGMELMSVADWQAAVEILNGDNGVYGRKDDLPVRISDDEMQLLGNVWEWTIDNADRNNAIIVGGSWKTSASDIKGKRLGKMKQNQFADDVGFRCVKHIN